jgi:flavin-dependent dehydrogenase
MTSLFDVAVVGGGPAGAAAALSAAAAGMRVALFEPQDRPDKPCGEGIRPAGVTALRALGLEELIGQGERLERLAYVLASGREIELDLPSAGCALDRGTLSAALDERIARQESIARVAERVTTRPSAGAYRLEAARSSWTARTLIAADGLQGECASWLRRARGPVRRHGLRARLQAREPLRRVEVHLGRACEVYLTPLPRARINVAVLCDEPPTSERSSAAWLAAALRMHPRAARGLGEILTPPEVRALGRARPRRIAHAGAFLAGDATGGVDPVLGCGVAIALVTGRAAGLAAARVVREGSGVSEREYARDVVTQTRLRRTVAGTLLFLTHHPRLQRGVAELVAAFPRGTMRLAGRVAGI